MRGTGQAGGGSIQQGHGLSWTPASASVPLSQQGLGRG